MGGWSRLWRIAVTQPVGGPRCAFALAQARAVQRSRLRDPLSTKQAAAPCADLATASAREESLSDARARDDRVSGTGHVRTPATGAGFSSSASVMRFG